MDIEELKTVVSQLSRDELREFNCWFENHWADVWDAEIEADVKAGRFDAISRKAIEDFTAGRCTKL